ncbi:MAG: hypothetical protein K9W43_11620 [Candidatus Thorarchaeota archaeon]|nr:hypothetical protein [Candidatus Thorarchaeota archaeon]
MKKKHTEDFQPIAMSESEIIERLDRNKDRLIALSIVTGVVSPLCLWYCISTNLLQMGDSWNAYFAGLVFVSFEVVLLQRVFRIKSIKTRIKILQHISTDVVIMDNYAVTRFGDGVIFCFLSKINMIYITQLDWQNTGPSERVQVPTVFLGSEFREAAGFTVAVRLGKFSIPTPEGVINSDASMLIAIPIRMNKSQIDRSNFTRTRILEIITSLAKET